ncbi:hypothetical protein [Hugenholtzia roseola]|nr:hypothetical protein [Hugenholtzia roseola]
MNFLANHKSLAKFGLEGYGALGCKFRLFRLFLVYVRKSREV